MAVTFVIEYERTVVAEDIPALPSTWKRKIRQAIEERLTQYPNVYGKPLRRSLKGYRKLRVGDYRVIFRIVEARVIVFAILHRSIAYQRIQKRIGD